MPLVYASKIAFLASAPYPYPNDMVIRNFYLASANFNIESNGSVPGSKNKSGLNGVLISYEYYKLNVGGS